MLYIHRSALRRRNCDVWYNDLCAAIKRPSDDRARFVTLFLVMPRIILFK